MATKLKNLKVTSVDVVPAGANPDAHICLFKTKKVKTEGGTDFPAAAYAYVPDPEKPSTWKLRLWEDPDKKVTAKQVGAAVAALGPGLRGKKVEIPDEDLPKVKSKVLTAWKQANPDAKDDEVPDILKEPAKKSASEPGHGYIRKILTAVAKMVGMPDDQIDKAAGDAESFSETYAQRIAQKQCDAACNEIWDMVFALENSLCTIVCDTSMDSDARDSAMQQSLDEFNTFVTSAIESWSQAIPTGKVKKSAVQMSDDHIDCLTEYLGKVKKGAEVPGATAGAGKPAQSGNGKGGNPPATAGKSGGKMTATKKGVTDTMKIDKSKMSPEEKAQLESFEKKYGMADGEPEGGSQEGGAPEGGVAKINPEVKKALEEVESLKKSLQLQQETMIAKKYEILGKKPEDVAKKLVDLKKAGGTAYDDYVALLDEQVEMFQKSGLFKEKGSNAQDGGGSSWDKVNKAADEVMKSDAKLSRPAAIAKACALHPELLDEYEQAYTGK